MKSEQTLFTRREFLLSSALAGLGLTIPQFLAQTVLAAGAADPSTTAFRDDRILVVIQLGGGNDGCNTVVPFGNDHYRTARPNLALDSKDLIKLNDDLALHPAMADFMDLLQAGKGSIINGAGYPNPDRSHFRSMEIWETASDADRVESHGWIGRYFDNCCGGRPDPITGISVAQEAPQSFTNRSGAGVSFVQPDQFRWQEGTGGDNKSAFASLNKAGSNHDGHDTLDFLRHTTANAILSSDRIIKAGATKRAAVEYPQGRLATSLRTIATLIAGGLPTRVYHASMTGFDTHANQVNTHANLLRQFSGAVAAFQKDLEKIGVADRVLTMCFSEFGRRISENASRGTDHGMAGPMFLVGQHAAPGLHGSYPSLAAEDLDDGDLRHTVDFRAVYGEVIERWLGAPQQPVLGRQYEHLGVIRKA